MDLSYDAKKSILEKAFDDKKLTIPISLQNVDELYDLFVLNIKTHKPYNNELCTYAAYYAYYVNDWKMAKKYYLEGITFSESCINDCAYYYRHIMKKYDKAEKYYLMGIEKFKSRYGYEQLTNMYKELGKSQESLLKNISYNIIHSLIQISEGKIRYFKKLYEMYGNKKEELLWQIFPENMSPIYPCLCVGRCYTEPSYSYKCMSSGFHHLCGDSHEIYDELCKIGHSAKIIQCSEMLMNEAINKNELDNISSVMRGDNNNKITSYFIDYCIKNKTHDKVYELYNMKILNDENIVLFLNKVSTNNTIDDAVLNLISEIDVDNVVGLCNNILIIKKLLTHQLDLMELHFKYSINGKGYDDAKKDFNKMICSSDTKK